MTAGEVHVGGRLDRWVLNACAALVAAFLVLPILAVVPAAFNERSFILLPPATWSHWAIAELATSASSAGGWTTTTAVRCSTATAATSGRSTKRASKRTRKRWSRDRA